MRTCVACRTQRQQADFVRVARTADGRVHVDSAHSIEGRGAYLCAETECLTAASARSQLARALRTSVPEHITDTLQQHESIALQETNLGRMQTTTNGGTHGA